jgi:type IV pilus assembly protein PilB
MQAFPNPETNNKSPEAQTADFSIERVGQYVADLLVENKLISREQLQYAMRIYKKLQSAKTLVSVLLELQLITGESLRNVLKANALSVPLGALLVELGYLREADLKAALALQADKPGRRLGEILTEAHFLKEGDLSEALSFQLGYELVSPADFNPGLELFYSTPIQWFRSRDCIPLARRDAAVLIAFADPRDRRIVDVVSRIFGDKIIVGIAGKTEIQQALNRVERASEKIPARVVSDNDIVGAVNDVINQAAESAVSDIHIEPGKQFLRIRFRKDGTLIKHMDYPLEMVGLLTNRVKIMSGIDISEKRRHQDGRMVFEYQGNPLDIRVSTFGTIYGEAIVLRLLNNRDQLLEILDIGMAPPVANRYIEDALDSPSGVIIITGPTGSGKTTTLYASIQYLNKIETSIITAEDPVEYVIDGISQCSINPKINVTYEDTLKHIVRQDPDVIVIGEIRDLFSAETAIQAALTGHKVLTTFHTEDSIGGLLRLLNMNIEAFLISSTVISVVAQRLVRCVCPHCAEDQRLNPHQIRRLGYEPRDAIGLTFKLGTGCSQCGFRGYKGRIAVFELLVLNEAVKDAIIARKTSYEIRRISMESSGLVTLLEDAIYKAGEGLTTYDEIIRQIPRLSKPRPLPMIQRLLRGE